MVVMTTDVFFSQNGMRIHYGLTSVTLYSASAIGMSPLMRIFYQKAQFR